MRVLLLSISSLIIFVHGVSRLKRQALPSNHVQVHSLDSNVSVSDVMVIVTSSDSRIDLLEKKLNLSTWASSSNVSFDTYDTFVNYTAVKAESFAYLQSVNLHTQSGTSEFSMTTNRETDGESKLWTSITGNVNVSVEDSGMRIQALSGKWADITANTRPASNVPKSMNIYSNMSNDSEYERKLVLSAVDSLYDMEAVLLGAQVRTSYGDVMIDIDPDYRRARIYTNTHTIELRTTISPFGIEFNEKRMLINAPFEETTATIPKNSTDVFFKVGQLSQLRVNRGGGELHLGDSVASADKINVTSMLLTMSLLSTREMDALSNQSHISMMTNSTTASLTSSYHKLHVSGGVPQMMLLTGNITINISTNPDVPVEPTLFPGFSAPPDKFVSIGPPNFPGESVIAARSTTTAIPSVTQGRTPWTNENGDGSSVTEDNEEDRTVAYRTLLPEATTVEATVGLEVSTEGEGPIETATINPVEGHNQEGQTTVGTDDATSTVRVEEATLAIEPSQTTLGEFVSSEITIPPADATTERVDVLTTDAEGFPSPATVSIPETSTVLVQEATTIPLEVTSGIPIESTSGASVEVTPEVPVEVTTTTPVEMTTVVVPLETTLDVVTDEVNIPTTTVSIDESFPSPAIINPIEGGESDASTVVAVTDFITPGPFPPEGSSSDLVEGSTGGAVSLEPARPTTQDDFVTPPTLIVATSDEFITPPTLITEEPTSTDDFAVGQFENTDAIPDNSFNIFATISGVQFPQPPTPLVAEQRLDDFTEPEALTSLEKRSPISRTESFRIRMRMNRKVNATDQSFREDIKNSLEEIANRTLEISSPIAERRRRNVEIDPIILNMTDFSQVKDNEAEAEFSVGLHDFDDIDSLIEALRASIANGSQNGIIIIEKIEIHKSSDSMVLQFIVPFISLIAIGIFVTLIVVFYKSIFACLKNKGPICCNDHIRVADSSSFRSFS